MNVKVNGRAAVRVGAIMLAAMLLGCAPRDGDPATSGWVIRKAEREGTVIIYGRPAFAGPAVEDFQRRFPKVKVLALDLAETVTRERIIAEAEGARPVADMAWAGAMQVQTKLINDGYAQTYHSREARNLPPWAVWRDQGFGVSSSPVVFAYNKRLLSAAEVPRSHAALLAALRADPARWRGKIAIYDPEKSEPGSLYLSADTQINPEGWALFEEIAKSRPGRYVGGLPLLRSLSSGEHVLAYNVTGSFVEWLSNGEDPNIGYIVPSDYHLSTSRVAFITRSAPHPNAARLFIDYLMSDAGQRKMGEGLSTYIHGENGKSYPGERPIRLGPALLADSDQARRAQMLARWRSALAEAP